MKKMISSLMMMASLAISGLAMAAEKGTSNEAMALTKKAVAYAKANGKEKAFVEFNNSQGQFVDRDLYVMAYDMAGNNKAHGSNAKLIGKNLIDIQDADGKYIVRGLIETAKKGGGWFHYKWPNPQKVVESKSTYVEKIDDDTLVGVGIYK